MSGLIKLWLSFPLFTNQSNYPTSLRATFPSNIKHSTENLHAKAAPATKAGSCEDLNQNRQSLPYNFGVPLNNQAYLRCVRKHHKVRWEDSGLNQRDDVPRELNLDALRSLLNTCDTIFLTDFVPHTITWGYRHDRGTTESAERSDALKTSMG